MLHRSRIRHFPWVSRWLIRMQYEFVSALKPHDDLTLMNFGYADAHSVWLEPQDETHRYSLQLYHHLARQIEWKDADVLEVSCGRGGGASFIMRYFQPRSYLGVDNSKGGLEFSRKHHRIPGLSFAHANAEELPFDDQTFDIILNVEASLYYSNIEQFFRHVQRLLKPGGYFLYADLRFKEEETDWIRQVKSTGLSIVHMENITQNVLRALELDRARRIDVVNRYVPSLLRKRFYFMIGLPPQPVTDIPHLSDRQYWSFILQKC